MNILDIVTVVSNPHGWNTRIKHARTAVSNWLKEPNVRVTIVECSFGDRGFQLTDLESDPRVKVVQVKSSSLVWNKENLQNIGISRLPHDAKYIGTFDADILFRKSGWATECINTLHLYPFAQPWTTALDLGPHGEVMATHTSFASLFHAGKPVFPTHANFWKFDNGPYEYSHTGYAHIWTREILDRIGGLFELGVSGSGDHAMLLSIVGEGNYSLPAKVSKEYRYVVKQWEARASTHINGKVGFVHQVIEHLFHGSKAKRGYVSRWDMVYEHDVNPLVDVKKNSYGVIEFSGNKPALERAFANYLTSRSEDSNTID